MANPVPIAEIMKGYAAQAVVHSRKFAAALDYSEQSLVDVDRILGQMTNQGLVKLNALSSEERENLWTFSKTYGGYVGEVMVRHLGASWKSKDAADNSLNVHLVVREQVTCSPPERVWQRLTQSEYDLIIGYYRGIQHVLGLTPFVPAEFKPKPWYRRLWK